MNLNLFNSSIIHGQILNGQIFEGNILSSFKPLICQIDPLPLGKGITDFGFTVVTAAIYLLYTASMAAAFCPMVR